MVPEGREGSGQMVQKGNMNPQSRVQHKSHTVTFLRGSLEGTPAPEGNARPRPICRCSKLKPRNE